MARVALTSHERTSGGRLRIAAAAALCVLLHATRLAADQAPNLTVREERGIYSVTARFQVDEPVSVALAVLTDYEQIPRFLPDVRTSVVRERAAGWAVVEQEAMSGLMMFSKRVHLILEIQEQPDALMFRDRCGRSFVRYEGSWRFSTEGAQTTILYELVAEPAFDVPGWMLKRLLRRDSAQMIERLQKEIAARATAPVGHTPQGR